MNLPVLRVDRLDLIKTQTMKKIYLILVLFAACFTAYGQVVINEVLYDPSNNALDGDANGDGVYDQEADAFIEFVNGGSTYVDMSGYQIWDDTTNGELRYTIPSGVILAPGGALVVFGGGTPMGYYGNALVLADTNVEGMNLNNSGEVIIIKDASGNVVLSFDSDALSNNPNESYTRNPDITGDFEQHAANTSRLFSPGLRVDSTVFARELHLQGIIDFTTPAGGSSGKAIHLHADSAISDLSNYGIGVANNGGGTDGIEFPLPALSIAKGDDILIVRDSAAMEAYLVECFREFEHIIVDNIGAVSQNGDDAIELFLGSYVIDTYGDPNQSGTGLPWEYSDAWAYLTDTGWYAAMPDCTDETENIYLSSCRYMGCPDVNVSSIEVEGEGGASTITTPAGTLQMMAMVSPSYAADTTFTWSVDDEMIGTISSMGLLTAVSNGTVVVTATANDGGGTEGSASITITNQGMGIASFRTNFVVYPNPAGDRLYIQHNTYRIDEVVLYSATAQEILRLREDLDVIDLSSVEAGVYTLEIRSGEEVSNIRLIKH